MKPFKLALTKPQDSASYTMPLEVGRDELLTHIHGVGATRSGKSKWLEWFCRGLYRRYMGFTLLDPQGQLSEDITAWLATMVPETKVVFFDPNRDDLLVTFNPFLPLEGSLSEPNYLTRIDVKAKRQAASTLKVWGAENAESTPRLGRWLYNLYYLFARGLATFKEAGELLSLGGRERREAVIARLGPQEQDLANEWRDLNSLRPSEFFNQIESTKNRLYSFINQPRLRQIFSPKPSLNFDRAFREQWIVICNLKPGDSLHNDDTKLLGSLLIDDLWSNVERHIAALNENPYYLLIDEVQKFVTPDLKEVLDRGAGKGLRLGVFHQHLDQLREQDSRTYASIVTNCKIKLAFGGLSYTDARMMVDEMFAGQLDLKEIKNVLEQTKFWPIYGQEEIVSQSYSESQGNSSSMGMSSGLNQATIARFDTNSDTLVTDVVSLGEGSSSGEFQGEGETHSQSFGETRTKVPVYRPVPYSEQSSVDFYSLEEQKERFAGALMRQYQRHLFIRVPGRDTVAALTPFVDPVFLPQERIKGLVKQQFVAPHASLLSELSPVSLEEVALDLLEDEHDEFLG